MILGRTANEVAGGGDSARDFPNANRLNLGGNMGFGGNQLTLSCFFSSDAALSGGKGLVARWDGSSFNSSWSLHLDPSQVNGLIHDGFTQQGVSATGLNTNGGIPFAHLAMTYDGSQMRVWWKGKLMGHGAANVNLAANGTPCIGDLALVLPWDGRIKHVAIWNAALTPSEVWELANGACPWDVRGSKLRAWIPLTGWDGGNARDLSLFNSSATPSGGTFTVRAGGDDGVEQSRLPLLHLARVQVMFAGFISSPMVTN
jgi:hypothetical protein